MMGGGAPLPYAREVEYLQSTSEQFLNIYTFLGTETKFRYNIDFNCTSNNSSSQNFILGVSNNGRIGPRVFGFYGNFCYSCDSGGTVIGQSFSFNRRYDIDCTFNSDGSISSSIDGAQPQTYSRPFYAEAGKSNRLLGATSSQYGFIGKIYSMKMWVDDVIARDLIPVIDLNGVACMYDKVSGELFYNAGTEAFMTPETNGGGGIS